MNTIPVTAGFDFGRSKISMFAGWKRNTGQIEIIASQIVPTADLLINGLPDVEKFAAAIRNFVTDSCIARNLEIRSYYYCIDGLPVKSHLHGSTSIRSNPESEITEEELTLFLKNPFQIPHLPTEKVIAAIHHEYSIENTKKEFREWAEEEQKKDPNFDPWFGMCEEEFYYKLMPKRFVTDEQTGIINPLGLKGETLITNSLLILAEAEKIAFIENCFQKAGIDNPEIQVSALAAGEAVLAEEEKEVGVAIVYLGSVDTTIAIYTDGFVRSIETSPINGGAITEKIKREFNVTWEQAEQLKFRFGKLGVANPAENEAVLVKATDEKAEQHIFLSKLFKLLDESFEEIAKWIYEQIEAWCQYDKKPLVAGLVMTGKDARMEGLAHYMESKTGVDTRIGYANEYLDKISWDEFFFPEYSAAVGLVKTGVDRMKYEPRPPVEQVDADGIVEEKPEPDIKPQKIRKSIFSDFIHVCRFPHDDCCE
jgi:cell division protein FtsA